MDAGRAASGFSLPTFVSRDDLSNSKGAKQDQASFAELVLHVDNGILALSRGKDGQVGTCNLQCCGVCVANGKGFEKQKHFHVLQLDLEILRKTGLLTTEARTLTLTILTLIREKREES